MLTQNICCERKLTGLFEDVINFLNPNIIGGGGLKIPQHSKSSITQRMHLHRCYP